MDLYRSTIYRGRILSDALQVQLRAAKAKLSAAAQDCLSGKPGAPEAANQAQAEVTALLAMQRAQAGQVCSEPGCKRLTLRGLCDVHRPLDPWSEVRHVLDEIGKEADAQ